MSVREEIDGDFIANSLRMDSYKGYYVLVEGNNDELFYSKFLNENEVQIEICHGKENILQAVQILDENNANKKYIGLVDKDYDFLKDSPVESNNLIRTDYHDIETICISSKAFEDFSKEYCKEEKVDKICNEVSKSLKEHILELARPIAGIRILSIKNNYTIKFKPSGKETKELDYTKFICKDKFRFLGLNTLMSTLERYYNQGLPKSNEEIISELEALNLDEYEILDIVHGHDLSNIIVIGLKKTIGKSSLNKTKRDEVERALRLAYSKEEFTKTEIFRNLKAISSKILK
ncbi:DUF4435 domain-containing protein [Tenacibaculum mesophilum]|uniref:DUF4435 domain-containing protein n=1 Tax=Tenacibaculum mesophilum TaxID=104268 RepID=UPI003F5E4623